MGLLKKPPRTKEQKLAKLTPPQRAELERIELEAVANFEGQLDELEAAIGFLRIGHHFGWKVLYIIHSKATIRKYEKILDIKIRDIFPEAGPSAYRSNGYRVAQAVSNFWKFISGDAPESKELSRETRRSIQT